MRRTYSSETGKYSRRSAQQKWVPKYNTDKHTFSFAFNAFSSFFTAALWALGFRILRITQRVIKVLTILRDRRLRILHILREESDGLHRSRDLPGVVQRWRGRQ